MKAFSWWQPLNSDLQSSSFFSPGLNREYNFWASKHRHFQHPKHEMLSSRSNRSMAAARARKDTALPNLGLVPYTTSNLSNRDIGNCNNRQKDHCCWMATSAPRSQHGLIRNVWPDLIRNAFASFRILLPILSTPSCHKRIHAIYTSKHTATSEYLSVTKQWAYAF